MPKSLAHVRTESPSATMKKLLRHFSHKIAVEFDDHSGSATFPFGHAFLRPLESELVIRLEAREEEALGRLQEVISSHLVRFASPASITVNWEPLSQ